MQLTSLLAQWWISISHKTKTTQNNLVCHLHEGTYSHRVFFIAATVKLCLWKDTAFTAQTQQFCFQIPQI